MSYCCNCGNANSPDARYCVCCGTSVEHRQASPMPTVNATAVLVVHTHVQTATRVVVLAPPGRRIGAFLIDWAILLSAMVAIGVFGNATKSTDGYGNTTHQSGIYIALVVGWVCAIVGYWWAQEASIHHATVGKRAVGLQVVRVDGTAITPGQAAGRAFARLLSFFLWGLGYLWSFWDPARQTWHDKMAETLVIDVRVTEGSPTPELARQHS
jgi:uncharacterized RDD family membrane protein YckC